MATAHARPVARSSRTHVTASHLVARGRDLRVSRARLVGLLALQIRRKLPPQTIWKGSLREIQQPVIRSRAILPPARSLLLDPRARLLIALDDLLLDVRRDGLVALQLHGEGT